MIRTIGDILNERFPGNKWNMSGESYDGLEWMGPGPKPTREEFDELKALINPEKEGI